MPSPAQRVIDRISQTCQKCGKTEIRLHWCGNIWCDFRACIECVLTHENEKHSDMEKMTPEDKANLDWHIRNYRGSSQDGRTSRELIAGVERGCK